MRKDYHLIIESNKSLTALKKNLINDGYKVEAIGTYEGYKEKGDMDVIKMRLAHKYNYDERLYFYDHNGNEVIIQSTCKWFKERFQSLLMNSFQYNESYEVQENGMTIGDIHYTAEGGTLCLRVVDFKPSHLEE